MTGAPGDELADLQALKTAAFHLSRRLRRMTDAAEVLGLDVKPYAECVAWAEQLNRYFNPPDLARRARHGDPTGTG